MKAVIVEDEREGLENLVLKLEKFCPMVEIIGKCKTGEAAITIIEQSQPQLVFLDIRLGTMSGFDVLDQLRHIHFELIFTTSYSQYAIQAIRENAIDYLMKPVKPAELKAAVKKAYNKIQTSGIITRIAVPISNGFQFISIDEITYCRADDNYTHVYRNNNKKVMVSRPLSDFERKLPGDKFYRVHRSFIINLDCVETFSRGAGGFITLTSGEEFSVSRARRDGLLRILDRLDRF